MKDQITMFCLLNSLDLQRGGLTKASLMQANTFASLGYKTFILTFNFNPRYNTIIEQMVSLRKIDSRIQVLNMYQSLGEFDYSTLSKQPMMEIEKVKQMEPSWTRILDSHIPTAFTKTGYIPSISDWTKMRDCFLSIISMTSGIA